MQTARRLGYFALGDLRGRSARRPGGPHAAPVESRGDGRATAVVYASEQCTELIFFEGDGVCYCRCLEAALDETPGARAAGDGGGSAGRVPRAFVSEIERSLQYYRRAYKEATQPCRLLLAGDHPAIDPAVAWLCESQGVEVLRIHPLAALAHAGGVPGGVDTPPPDDAFIAALGGALRRVDPAGIHLQIASNLREEASAEAEVVTRYRRTALIAAVTLAVIGLLTTSLLNVRLWQARQARDDAAGAVQAAREGGEGAVLRQQGLEADLRRLRRRRMPLALLLRRLQRAVPSGTALTALELAEDGTLALRGEARDVARVRALVRGLTDDRRFRAPELETLDAPAERDAVLFAVRTGWSGSQPQGSRQP